MLPKKAALLDVDGTLVDSNDAHAMSWVEAFGAFGHDVPFERVRELIGKGGDKLLPETIGVAKDSPRGTEIAERRGAIFTKTYLPHLRAFPCARELVLAMKEAGLALVVATSAEARELDAILEVAGLRDILRAAVTSDDADDSKPDPDIVIAALHRAHCRPGEAVMIGDTPYDVTASRRAGVDAIALRCGGWSDRDLEGASAIYDDPAALLEVLQSPRAARHVFV